MSFINKPHVILLFIFSSTFILFVPALDLSNVPAESPTSDQDGFLPLAGKHVVICNKVKNRESLNVHCRSSEDDLGLIHIPWNHTWGFRFHVNIWKSTKFRCHFTWLGGGSHYFTIFKVSRDDSIIGYPVYKECIWEVGKDDKNPICRVSRDKAILPHCFQWEEGP
ncbi:Plant self-incompatibility S1 [Arabidopsis thaliana x Arabidopsis arenosa]|uniref:S-protein homolog n=1 Tax=Arabidopsis thaliana x Arabidopsis arenosa TaxID=1240361 RepID=A0A8T1ZNJ0_9BRAS|nr:Plant self-incompatibility S1 [Arabidopsis thaliana x Arabidopsis arenosa]